MFINRNFPESVWRNLISGKRYTFQNGAKQINLFRVLYNDVTRRGNFVDRLAEFPMHFIVFVLLSLLSAFSFFFSVLIAYMSPMESDLNQITTVSKDIALN